MHWLIVALVANLAGAPLLQNASFEADRYSVSPGTAAGNGKTITGWSYSGNAGVNPIWKNPQAQKGPDSPFYDNGAVPDGKQLAFIQGPGKLSQMVGGFEQGHRYVVGFRENARVQHQGDQWPQVRVTLGGQVIVSPHEVTPIAKKDDLTVPFYRVESALFTAPKGGEFELVTETVQESRTTTILLDAVEIREVGEG